MNRFSACIITLNEEHNLPRVLASLQGIADEIIVVDSGSTDRTQQIAHESGAAVHVRQWTHYADQKNYAASLSKTDWVLSLDADEVLSSPLQTALLDWKKRPPQFDAYEVARKTWYLGAWIKHSGWYPDFKTRLYRKTAAQFDGTLHETLRFAGPHGRLAGDLLHYTIHSFADHEANVESYSTLAAQQMFDRGKRQWRGAVWFAAPWTFFQNFVLRSGFLDGYRGLLIAKMAAKTVKLKYNKLGRLVATKRAESAPRESAK